MTAVQVVTAVILVGTACAVAVWLIVAGVVVTIVGSFLRNAWRRIKSA